jgi:hypothetical protein
MRFIRPELFCPDTHRHCGEIPRQAANEQTIRKLYSLAEAATKDTEGFVSMFGDGGHFYDVVAAKKLWTRYRRHGRQLRDRVSRHAQREYRSALSIERWQCIKFYLTDD